MALFDGSLGLLAQAGADAAARVGAGRIQGGWGYVWTSYAITWVSLSLYGASLWLRHRRPPASGGEA